MRHLSAVLVLAMLLNADFTQAGNPVVVEIKDFAYRPGSVTVKVGQGIRWVNKEKRQYHNVWFETLGEPEPPYLFPEEAYQRTFTRPGEYPYRCGPHPEMRGTVTVVE